MKEEILAQPYAIFDVDGTLLDSMPFWHNMGRDYLKLHGREAQPDIREVLEPLSMEESGIFLKRQYGLPETAAQITAGLNEWMAGHYRTDIPARPGVCDYLTLLAGRGTRMAVATATALPLVEAALVRTGLRPFFTSLVSCDEVGVGKKKPDVFTLAMKRLGAWPDRKTVIYEDAWFAIRTAKKLGCRVVGVYDADCSVPPEEVAAYCDAYIRDWRQEKAAECSPAPEV